MVDHASIIRAPKSLVDDPGPLILERTDARFMDAVRLELGNVHKRDQLLATRAVRKDGALQLCQPIHRAFNIAVLEVVCDTPGQPRLDPAKVESAGLVVRRIVERDEGEPDGRSKGSADRLSLRARKRVVEQAWMKLGDAVQGWVDLDSTQGSISLLDDPEPARRKRNGTHPVLAEQLERMRFTPAALVEDVSALFVLPPDVCAAAKATLLYGLVTTTSLDHTKAEPAALFDTADVLADLPNYLKSVGTLALERNATPRVPNAGGWLTRPQGAVADSTLLAYSEFVERVIAEYDLFGDTPGADRLRMTLDGIEVSFWDESTKSLTAHLREAANVLVYPPPAPTLANPNPAEPALLMPIGWPDINAAQERDIVSAVGDILRHQIGRLQSHEPRFGNANARYVARAFVRVRGHDACPPVIYWSQPTEPFTIAPWYEPSRGPTPIIQLPDPFKDMGKFKPNVAFALPPSISDVVHRNTAEKLMKGEGKRGAGVGLGWLCGFNIPLITLCAFIVLSIFLSLLQIIFWWLAFIRICIPIPVPKTSNS